MFRLILLHLFFLHITLSAADMVAVLKLDFSDIEPEKARALTRKLREEFINAGIFEVMNTGTQTEILSENGLGGKVCEYNECAFRMGRVLKADKVCAGTINSRGERYRISVRLLDVQNEEVLRFYDEIIEGGYSEAMEKGMSNCARKLSGLEPLYDFKEESTDEFGDIEERRKRNTASGGGVLKSSLVPGWGQVSVGRKRGYAYTPLTVGLISAYLLSRKDKYIVDDSHGISFETKKQAEEFVNSNSAFSEYHLEKESKPRFLIFAGTVYVLNIIDIIILSRDKEGRDAFSASSVNFSDRLVMHTGLCDLKLTLNF